MRSRIALLLLPSKLLQSVSGWVVFCRLDMRVYLDGFNGYGFANKDQPTKALILDHPESQEASKEAGDNCALLERTLRMAWSTADSIAWLFQCSTDSLWRQVGSSRSRSGLDLVEAPPSTESAVEENNGANGDNGDNTNNRLVHRLPATE
ncbi:hypothetical protein QBC42DRAFT_251454 [Cladorrhinum samala]|uniref:Uncharacterized protein n=1 Tax=Cladorrhinum samala TaxID=585594 RepID=A0AAV9HP35_9PEZI|nr:hypothetical protein QBC42DRAFT_251454 [Cladorrhinum samala]